MKINIKIIAGLAWPLILCSCDTLHGIKRVANAGYRVDLGCIYNEILNTERVLKVRFSIDGIEVSPDDIKWVKGKHYNFGYSHRRLPEDKWISFAVDAKYGKSPIYTHSYLGINKRPTEEHLVDVVSAMLEIEKSLEKGCNIVGQECI